MSSDAVAPEVLWAQRSSKVDEEKNYITLTINTPDVKTENLVLDLEPTEIKFKGVSSGHDVKKYELELPLYGEIDPEKSSKHHTAHSIRLKLQKKELKEEYWPRLQKDAKKLHFVKTDFDKWVDEDEQDEAPEDDFSQFGNMGGMPGMGGMGGMPGMGGMGGMPGMGGMGGMGGMPGMGGGDFGDIDFSKLGGAGDMPEDDEDDDEMPALEGEEDVKATKESAKEPAKEPAKTETESKA